MTQTPPPTQMVSFAAWRDGPPHVGRPTHRHYVTLAELLVRLGSYGLALTWKVQLFDDPPHPAFVRMLESSSTGPGIPTLELLAMHGPHVQAIDGDFEGYADGELVLTLREFDSSSWDVRTADEWVLGELRRCYPDARAMTADEWDASGAPR